MEPRSRDNRTNQRTARKRKFVVITEQNSSHGPRVTSCSGLSLSFPSWRNDKGWNIGYLDRSARKKRKKRTFICINTKTGQRHVSAFLKDFPEVDAEKQSLEINRRARPRRKSILYLREQFDAKSAESFVFEKRSSIIRIPYRNATLRFSSRAERTNSRMYRRTETRMISLGSEDISIDLY